MKIKLSKSQWESIGQKSGWIKSAQINAFPRKFKWTVVFEVDAKHVAAGFEITDDMVKNMIANAMPTVTSDEFNAVITTRPPASAIRLVQGG